MVVTNTVKVLLINERSGKLLLIRRSGTDDRRPGQWDIPGGMAETGESLEEAAVRECREESGIELDPAGLKLVYTRRHFFEQESAKLVNWLLFHATTTQEEVRLSYEHSDFCWVEVAQALKMIEYDRYQKALSFLYKHQLV